MERLLKELLTYWVVLGLLIGPVLARSAEATPISTSEFIERETGNSTRTQLSDFLARQDVADALKNYGVDPLEARLRVAHLTDLEVEQVTGMLDELPAGGGAVGAVVGGILIVFLVLLFTDILGVTKVFPFTRSVR